MEYLEAILFLLGELGALIPVFAQMKKIIDGEKCQLRHDMLEIYYRNAKEKILRQYEYEDFMQLYHAYKALKGNSFIDKIYKEIQDWKVIQ